MYDDIDISVVIPCLDEEDSVGGVVGDAWEGIGSTSLSGEVIVVDNGSTDRSAEMAASRGASVVREPRRGYGSAYLAGLAEARGSYIVMGDADGTYPLHALGQFVARLAEGDALVLGSRFGGKIHRGAMPWSHRWIGNPVLTGMLRLLCGSKISDAHCGMRAVRRDALPTLDLRATGMEFASEMIFKATRRGLRVSEIPIDYYPRTGNSKLKGFRDAWRHVRFMLLYSPSWLFFLPAVVLALPGLMGMLAFAAGPVSVFGRTWQIHALYLCVMLVLLGAQIAQFGLIARTFAEVQLGEPDPLLRHLSSRFRMEHGLLVGAIALLAGLGIVLFVAARWGVTGFGSLDQQYLALVGLTLAALGIQGVFTSFLISIVGQPAVSRLPGAPSWPVDDLDTAPGVPTATR